MNAPREELAWMVVIDPSLPWLIALSIGTTSLPRTSPTITRSGVIRSAHRTSSASDLPFALHVLLPGLHRDHVRVGAGVPVQAQLEAVLDRDQPLARRDRRG